MSVPSDIEIINRFYPTRPTQTCILKPYSEDKKDNIQTILKIFNLFTREFKDQYAFSYHGTSMNGWICTTNFETPNYVIYEGDETQYFNIIQKYPINANNISPSYQLMENSKKIYINGGSAVYMGEPIFFNVYDQPNTDVESLFNITISRTVQQHWFILMVLEYQNQTYGTGTIQRVGYNFVPLNDGNIETMPVFTNTIPNSLGVNLIYLNTIPRNVNNTTNYYVRSLENYNFRIPESKFVDLYGDDWEDFITQNQLTTYAPFWRNYLVDGGVVNV